jgi:hypothetical protein
VIEQLFRVMKSQGLQLEDSQLASADRLVKLAAVATKAACIDIQLTQERDGAHGLTAATVFRSWKATPSKCSARRWKVTPSGRKTPSPPKPGACFLGDRPARRLELLLQAARTDYLQA